MSTSTDYDVAVVGGGPGGATAAYYLGRAGLKTLLIDKAKFPRDKSCGDAVCAKSVRVLRDMQVEAALAPFYVPRGQLFSNLRGDSLSLPFAAKDNLAPAYVIKRHIFDEILFRHAERVPSVTTLEEHSFVDLIRNGSRVTGVVVQDKRGGEHRHSARIVIGADGAMSRVAEKLGIYDFKRKNHDHWIGAFRIYYEDVAGLGDRIEIHYLDELVPGYLWIFPLGGGMCNVGAGMVESYLQGHRGGRKINLRERTYELLASHPRFRSRFSSAHEVEGSFKGWQLPCGSERRKIVGDGWILIGDAASLIDPFSGEGIGNAMYSGKLAAEHAVSGLRTGDMAEALNGYERRIWNELGPELRTAHRLQQMVARPWQRRILDYLIHRAATRQTLREAIGTLMVEHQTSKLSNLAYCLALLVGDGLRSGTDSARRALGLQTGGAAR